MFRTIDYNLAGFINGRPIFPNRFQTTKKNKTVIRQTLAVLVNTTSLISYLRESQNRPKNRVFELIFEVSRAKIPLFILNLPFPTHQGALGRIK